MAANVNNDGLSDIGLYGLGVMGRNFGFNIADKGFYISLCNRSRKRVIEAINVGEGKVEDKDKLKLKGGINKVRYFSEEGPVKIESKDSDKKESKEQDKKKPEDPEITQKINGGKTEFQDGESPLKAFVQSIRAPRSIIMLVPAGKPVRDTINALVPLLDNGDLIIDGGNEWYINTEMRAARLDPTVEEKDGEKKRNYDENTSGIIPPVGKTIHYMGMGVSGGEDGARNGPSLMPGGSDVGYKRVEHILRACAADKIPGEPDFRCVTYIGPRGAGNYVKMVHNGIEYGDMQLIAEAYDLLKLAGGLSNDQLAQVFSDWNESELSSFLIEITAKIFKKRDDRGPDANAYLVDFVLDSTGAKGTGMMTIKEAATQGIAAPTISAALNARNVSNLVDERAVASKRFTGPDNSAANADIQADKAALDSFINDVKAALYASKIMSYTQGMNLIRAVGEKNGWELDLGAIASIWRGGCIIRAQFLNRITEAYTRNKELKSLLFDDQFAQEVKDREAAWRRVVARAVTQGIPVPALAGSLAYYDSYRRERLPANLTQSQRDFFGRHTFVRIDDCANDENGKKEKISANWDEVSKL